MLSAFLLPLLAAMVGAYQLAGEAETGTIKTWLMHSISRGGVLTSKWGTAIVYVTIGMALVFLGGLAAGALAFGLHAPVLLSGQTVSIGHGLWLTLLSFLYVLVGVICILSLALLFATFTNSSLTAAIGALVVFIVMNILGAFSYFDFLKPYLFTSHLDAWQNLLDQPISWHPIVTGLITFAVYIAGLMACGLVSVPAQGHPGLDGRRGAAGGPSHRCGRLSVAGRRPCAVGSARFRRPATAAGALEPEGRELRHDAVRLGRDARPVGSLEGHRGQDAVDGGVVVALEARVHLVPGNTGEPPDDLRIGA